MEYASQPCLLLRLLRSECIFFIPDEVLGCFHNYIFKFKINFIWPFGKALDCCDHRTQRDPSKSSSGPQWHDRLVLKIHLCGVKLRSDTSSVYIVTHSHLPLVCLPFASWHHIKLFFQLFPAFSLSSFHTPSSRASMTDTPATRGCF